MRFIQRLPVCRRAARRSNRASCASKRPLKWKTHTSSAVLSTPPHTAHIQQFPNRVTIIRPHHALQGHSLEVLQHANRQGQLWFVLILPDESKSLIPAAWTDFATPATPPQSPQLAGSLDDLLRLRGLVDALLQRRLDSAPITSGPGQESHAATESELP